MIQPLPPLSAQLVEELAAMYPPRCIGPNQSEIEAHRYAAQCALVQGLVHRMTANEDTVLQQ